ncbi:MAG TPA: HlyD family efflux transporter periplasmic adaptor subunit, partial [bacterium]|nr:HlyD family efflux transporter periplasmic adaptor subunit [bacterium]
FDAVVSRVYLNPGAAVAPSVPVVTLVAPGGWITAEVDEADIDAVRIGQAARITADAYPAMALTGRVTRIGGAVELRGGNRVVRVRIDPLAPIVMRAGTSVDVAIVQRTVADALLVPLDAVQPAEDGAAEVFVIERGALRRRAVRLGERNDELAQVADGLREGEYVALGDAAVLREGARIRLRARL